MRKSHVALYGNTAIQVAQCPECKGEAWVIQGKMACCDVPPQILPRKYKRVISPEQKRAHISKALRKALLIKQEFKCFYCERQFGNTVYNKKGFPRKLKTHGDHFVPFSYSQNNKKENIVLACQVCNCIKQSLCFQTTEEAKLYINTKWTELGWKDQLIEPIEAVGPQTEQVNEKGCINR